MKLIDKDALVAEINKRIMDAPIDCYGHQRVWAYNDVKDILDTLEVKESKLSNPRFPHLDNIVDKVFGTGNLESWEYEEAEQLVLLAKEELIEKVCEFLDNDLCCYIKAQDFAIEHQRLKNDLKKHLEGKL